MTEWFDLGDCELYAAAIAMGKQRPVPQVPPRGGDGATKRGGSLFCA